MNELSQRFLSPVFSSSSVAKPKCSEIACETIEGEVIIIHLKTGTYYSLEAIAAEIWAWIEAGLSLQKIVLLVLEQYEGLTHEIEGAIKKFLDQLCSENLIAIEQNSTLCEEANLPEHNAQQNSDKTAFQAPVLTKYTDMQDLLLLDPIHEVAPRGWPQRAEESAQ